jgi:orotate phosphoribosyltransferase
MTTHSDAVLALTSARTGHFRLESGHHGELWLELDAMFWSPAALGPLVAEMADRLNPHAPDVVCGPLVGGALLAQLVAARLGVAFCFTERTSGGDGRLYSAAYRLPAAFAALVAGRRVAVVDDVVNAGSATRATLAALGEARAKPVALGALLTLGARPTAVAAAAGLPLVALANRGNELWEPAECPRCAAGEPLDVAEGAKAPKDSGDLQCLN